MLGNLTNITGTGATINTTAQSTEEIDNRLNGLETKVENQKNRIDALSEEIITNDLIADDITTQRIGTNSIEASSVIADGITADNITADEATIDTITADTITGTQIIGDTLKGQVIDRQDNLQSTNFTSNIITTDNITADTATITNLTTTSITMEGITAQTGNIDAITADGITTNTITADTATVDDITSDGITTDAITANTATVDTITAEDITANSIAAQEAETDKLTSPVIIGSEVINLDPHLPTQDDYYLLKIKKNFQSLNLNIEDSLDIRIFNSHTVNAITNGCALVLSNAHTIKDIVLYSSDDDYYYIEISPNNTNELHYSYTALEEVAELITVSINEQVPFEWYYKQEKLSEAIYLGAVDYTKHNYQFTVLGKLKAEIGPEIEDYVFDNITINRNVYVKDYTDEETGEIVYKKGGINDYLSNIEDYYDEETQRWETRLDWRERIHLREAADYTDPTTEDVIEENGRRIKPEADTLMDVGTLRHYNGQWIAPGHSEYTEITVRSGQLLMNAEHMLTYTGEVAIQQAFDEIGFTPTLYPISDCEVAAKYSMPDGYYVKDDNTGEYKAIKYLLSVSMWGSTLKDDVIFSDADGNFIHSAYEERDNTSGPPNKIKCYTRESTPASTSNPITKLGIVDEGTWIAGDVTTPNLLVKNSMTVNPQSITWHNKDYQVWLDGEEPEDDDLDWVEV